MKGDDMKFGDRRKVLKSIGGVGALALSPSIVSAKDGQSVKEAGIEKEFENLITEGSLDDAFELLDDHNVKYSHVQETPGGSNSSESGGLKPSPEDYYETGNSSVSFYTSEWDASKNQYAIGVGWTVENHTQDFDGPAPKDSVVLAFEDDVFGFVDDEITSSGTLKTEKDKDLWKDGLTKVLSEPASPHEDAMSNGAVAEFDDNFQKDLDNDGSPEIYNRGEGVLQMIIRKQDTSTKGIVSGMYTHTWSALNVKDWDILDKIGWTIPGTGISVEVPLGADKWNLPNSEDRDEEL